VSVRILVGDARAVLATLPAESVHCVVTSPPYWGLRSYIADGDPLKPYELGLEPTPELYVAHLVEVFRAVRRVLRSDGVMFCNLGDAYHDKQLLGLPWRVAFALQADGWWLRQDIVIAKKNPMPESVRDRCTRSHELLFVLAKNPRYYWDAEAIKEPATYPDGMNGTSPVHSPYGQGFAAGRSNGSTTTGRNKRSVWTIASEPFSGVQFGTGADHFATFPPALVEPCVKAGTSERGCCAQCGAPWRREVAHSYDNPGNRTTNGPRSLAQRHETAGFPVRLERRSETLGWAPICACAPTPVPCRVLDPFAGAGTVGLVAERLGRDAILIELKPAYAAMAERRIREEAPLLTAVAVEGELPAEVEGESGEPHGKALTTPRNDGARWSLVNSGVAPRGRDVRPPATGNGQSALAPEQLALVLHPERP
jgi:DNA modification methylase